MVEIDPRLAAEAARDALQSGFAVGYLAPSSRVDDGLWTKRIEPRPSVSAH
jgi:hypothetical protein